MSWTAPRTHVTGEITTASILNIHLRDNLLETAPAKVTTAGDLVQATAANALARLGLGTQGYRLRAGASAVEWAPTVFVRKTAQQTRTANTNLIDVDDLLIAMLANQKWIFEGFLITDGPLGADIKLAFTVPAAATLAWSALSIIESGTSGQNLGLTNVIEASGTVTLVGTLGSGTKTAVRIWGTVLNGANAGNLQLQFAQATSDGSGCSIWQNSWLKAHELP